MAIVCLGPLCDTLRGGHVPAKRLSSRPRRPQLTVKTGHNTHYSRTFRSHFSSMTMLARPDATVAMKWPTVHEKTSHESPTGAYEMAVQRGRLGSDQLYAKWDFSKTPWRWLYWLYMVPVTPKGNYLT